MAKVVVVEFGEGCLAEMNYEAPTAAPASGSDWPQACDYPGISLNIKIPQWNGRIATKFQCEQINLVNEALTGAWGESQGAFRRRGILVRRQTLKEAERIVRLQIEIAQEVIQTVLQRRQSRLELRERSIAVANGIHGEVTAED